MQADREREREQERERERGRDRESERVGERGRESKMKARRVSLFAPAASCLRGRDEVPPSQ